MYSLAREEYVSLLDAASDLAPAADAELRWRLAIICVVLGRNDEARLTLRDPALDRDLVFDAFGSSNRKAFETLLEKGRG